MLSQKTKNTLFDRSQGLCESCGQIASDAAHIEPKMSGGRGRFKAFFDDPRNQGVSCRKCHRILDRVIKEEYSGQRDEILQKFMVASGWNSWGLEAISKGIRLRNKVSL